MSGCTIRTVAIGVDASDNSRHAFAWAASLCATLDADLLLVHAVGLLEHRADPGHREVHGWLDGLQAPGVRVEPIVRDGDAIVVLEAVVTERDVDLLVVGARGVGGTPSLLLGSTSTKLLQRSLVPVTVVPAEAESPTP